ncbi:MAG: NADH-quinone oxidoreductase subunit L, partial [Proteobacteria bacterium]
MYQAIVFLPLIGFLVVGLFGNSLGAKASEYITSGLLVIAAVLSWIAFFAVAFGDGEAFVVPVLRWIQSGGIDTFWALRIDTLTVVMLIVVNTVSALVHIYSIGYMHHDPHRPRFFAYLSLFTFAMLMLVTADNLVQMFFGWEGVGLASYLLIGFWYKRPSANAAAIKAFVVNRVGDFGFLLGILGVFVLFGSVNLSTIFANAASFIPAEGSEAAANGGTVLTFLGYALDKGAALTVVCLLLFMGAMGKSAQVPLHTWLPDAMEGPTPVSALIHAATMVTAGVFMLARLSPLFELSVTALTFVTFIGAITAFFAATVGLVQNDIKRVIAYSTCSQLGYMFVALGVGAYGAAIFHLFTHAFFKALLFLGSGSVIHAMSDEQDMRKMGGIRKLIPTTYWMMVIGTLALTGVGIPMTWIGFAGFFSKDAIIESAFVGQNTMATFAFVLLVISAGFTSFYSWRLIFMTFHGEPRADSETMHHVHESPPVMLIPLYALAVGAVFAGALFSTYFIGEGYEQFWKGSLFTLPENHVLHDIHGVPLWVKLAPIVVTVVGFLVAWQFYIRRPEAPRELAARHRGLYAFLLNKWYFDELYDFVFVRFAKWLGYT